MLAHSQYKGLLEKAAPGTHSRAFQLIKDRQLPRATQVLDVAAGNGAFASRLHDHGFQHITVTELAPGSFPFPTEAVHPWDLNEEFSRYTDARFELITAIEIIEHLDSPLHFLRQIHALLADNGHVLLTSPNVQNIMSRLKFLLTGELKSFSRQDFIDQRHIHGLTDHQIKIFFDIVGFEVVAQSSAGSFYPPLKNMLLRPLHWLGRFLKGHVVDGDVNLYLVRKARARQHLESSLAHYRNVATEVAP